MLEKIWIPLRIPRLLVCNATFSDVVTGSVSRFALYKLQPPPKKTEGLKSGTEKRAAERNEDNVKKHVKIGSPMLKGGKSGV